MAVLDFSQYEQTVGAYSDEEAAKALVQFAKQMDPGVHEVVITDIPMVKDEKNVEGLMVLAKDPNWAKFCVTVQNAAGEQSNQYLMFPLTNNINYYPPGTDTTKPASMSFKSFNNFLGALGFEPEMQGVSSDRWFMLQCIRTNGEFLKKLIGFQLKLKLEWRKNTVHPTYVSEDKSWYIVDLNGEIPSPELQEPFVINKDIKGQERWAEMKLAAQRAGYVFTSNMDSSLMLHDTIKNDLASLIPAPEAKKTAPIMGAAKATATTKPGPKVLNSKPPFATAKAAALTDSTPPE